MIKIQIILYLNFSETVKIFSIQKNNVTIIILITNQNEKKITKSFKLNFKLAINSVIFLDISLINVP